MDPNLKHAINKVVTFADRFGGGKPYVLKTKRSLPEVDYKTLEELILKQCKVQHGKIR